MDDNITWVVLTDGYYIKIMYYVGEQIRLSTYRNEDFEHSSKLTYKLITRKKDAPAEENMGYSIKLFVDFLDAKYSDKSFNSLVLMGPEEIIDKLDQALPDKIRQNITARIVGDYLAVPQDELENKLSALLTEDTAATTKT